MAIELPDSQDKMSEQLDLYKVALKDIRYLINQYRTHPVEALEAVEKVANDPKLRKGGHR